jgi:uncharacterized protein (TIGR00730 family)
MNIVVKIFHGFGIALKAGFQMAYGTYRLSQLVHPIVAIFGGTSAYESGKYADWAQQVGYECVKNNMSVVTGGGPGVMVAANCGASKAAPDKRKWTLGIGVQGVDEQFANICAPLIMVDYFFVRKWLLTRYSCGFILFPGGIGTMDEFFEVLNLMKLGKMKRAPIVLVGSSYWKNLISWFEHAFEYELIAVSPQTIFVVTDDPLEAVRTVTQSCQKDA